MNSITDALAIAKKQAKIDDDSQDVIITSFLESGAAKCPDDTITYRPYMAAAFLLFTTEYQKIMSDRYRLGLLEGDGAKFINPLDAIKEYLLGLLRVQSALDCGKEQCIPDCWKADKLIDDINCGCAKKTTNATSVTISCFSAFVP